MLVTYAPGFFKAFQTDIGTEEAWKTISVFLVVGLLIIIGFAIRLRKYKSNKK
jgi:hypothetical protein